MINRIEYDKFIEKIKGDFVLNILKIEKAMYELNGDELAFIRNDFGIKLQALQDITYPLFYGEDEIILHKRIFSAEIDLLEYLIRKLTLYIRMVYMSHKTIKELFKKDILIHKVDNFKRTCDIYYSNYEKRVLGYDD